MWEVAIKYSKGKLPISGAMFLHITSKLVSKSFLWMNGHVLALENLTRQDGSPPHKDPFDKIMLAQAKADSMLFIPHNRQFTYYNEPWVVMV